MSRSGRKPRSGRDGFSLALVLLLPLLPLGCATLGDRGETLVPTRYKLSTGPFVVYSNTPIAADSPAIRCLHSLETDLATRLASRAGAEEEPVEIYVLSDRNAYTHFLKFYYPELPPRRAFFLAQGERRVVYTYLSDRLEEDLRHEATHALLRGSYGDLPLWLDEGLAEYFETHPDTFDAQDEHLAKLPDDLKKGWTPDLPRLESLTDIHQMTPRDYRESWAWVHLLLADSQVGKPLLIDYLNQGRARSAASAPLSAPLRAAPRAKPCSLTWKLCNLGYWRKPEPPSQDRLIRFQDRPADLQDRAVEPALTRVTTAPAPVPRPSLLRRIGAFFGL